MTAPAFKPTAQRLGEISYREGSVALPSGRQMHYVDYGGEGEVVIALHGYVQNARAFDGIAMSLVPHVRLLALDFRGRGGSDWGPVHEYRVNYYLQDFQEFVAVLGLKRIALIGTCLGGLVSFLYAMAHLSEVTRIVFNDFSLTGDPNVARFVAQRYGRTPAKFVALADAVDWFLEEHILDALDDDALEAWVSHFLTPLPSGGFRLNCDPKLLQLMRQSQFYGTADRAPPVLLQRSKLLEMPVMIMRGAESDVVSQDEARLMAESLPAGRWVDVPGAGHSPTLYEPEARTALRQFFGIAEAD